jgi:hypothetical protein
MRIRLSDISRVPAHLINIYICQTRPSRDPLRCSIQPVLKIHPTQDQGPALSTLRPVPASALISPTAFSLFDDNLFTSLAHGGELTIDTRFSQRATVFELNLFSFAPSAPTEQAASVFGAKYKKIAKRTFPVSATTPEEFRIVRRSPPHVLANMKTLPAIPPPFTPGSRYTMERKLAQNIDPTGFLQPDEVELAHWVIRENEAGFAWDETEKGSFSAEWFDPIKIPTVEHLPWVLKNIPLPPGIRGRVIEIIKSKIAAGTYEPSNSSYRSAWFCVLKKDGKSLRLVHDLQPLNRVTIRDAAVPPIMDQMAEDFAGRACYGVLDLFVAFDQRSLDIASRDYTTFQTPLGTFRLTAIPMGYTNAAQIMQGDVTFILQDEIPDFTTPYIDDVPVKGPQTRYELGNGHYETITDNPGIRRFVFDHLSTMHRILHRMRAFGGTFSGPKSLLCAPSIELVGHHCSYEGRIPDQSWIKVILDWPACASITDVRSFLGTCGVMRVFIKDFARIARPLVRLTQKDTPFEWGAAQQDAMDVLKQAFATSRALRPIDYQCGRTVFLSVDSSIIAVGYVLAQQGADGRRYPARFGSIPWNRREAQYSQPKIELYGLFRALREERVHLVGIEDLVVEMDASSVKGMLNNPDLQPNATINRWIAAIKLFHFRLEHVPATQHKGPDGLSRRPPADHELADTADAADAWIDEACGFAQAVIPDTATASLAPPTASAFNVSDSNPGTGDNEWSTAVLPPRDEKANAADDRVQLVDSYLRNPLAPLPLDPGLLQGFIRYAHDFFLFNGRLWRRGAEGAHQLVITDPRHRLSLLQQGHDALGHKGKFATRRQLLLRFWWPHLDADVAWFDNTCLECQRRRTHHVTLPPTVAYPAPLFRKLYCDTMHMPVANKLKYIVHGRCSLTGWPEWRALRVENAEQIGRWLFEDVLCRWGGVEEIVTDNGPQFIAAATWLASKYGVHHIRISPYNSRANLVERRHFDVREAIVKTAGNDVAHWYKYAPHVFWAERVTVQRATGHSPYYMAHGVEPVLPFDLEEATWLISYPTDNPPATTTDLLAARARALQKRDEDLDQLRSQVFAARVASTSRSVARNAAKIIDFNFDPGSLVLVRNSENEKNLSGKTNPRYLGPMVVVRRNTGGAYILAELDGALSRLRYAAARLVPYHPRQLINVDIGHLTGLTSEELAAATADDPVEEQPPDFDIPALPLQHDPSNVVE